MEDYERVRVNALRVQERRKAIVVARFFRKIHLYALNNNCILFEDPLERTGRKRTWTLVVAPVGVWVGFCVRAHGLKGVLLNSSTM